MVGHLSSFHVQVEGRPTRTLPPSRKAKKMTTTEMFQVVLPGAKDGKEILQYDVLRTRSKAMRKLVFDTFDINAEA